MRKYLRSVAIAALCAFGSAAPIDIEAKMKARDDSRGAPAKAAVQEEMLADLLDWYVATTDVTPLAEDSRALPPAPTPGQHRATFWWEQRNPALHPELELTPLRSEQEEYDEGAAEFAYLSGAAPERPANVSA